MLSVTSIVIIVLSVACIEIFVLSEASMKILCCPSTIVSCDYRILCCL